MRRQSLDKLTLEDAGLRIGEQIESNPNLMTEDKRLGRLKAISTLNENIKV